MKKKVLLIFIFIISVQPFIGCASKSHNQSNAEKREQQVIKRTANELKSMDQLIEESHYILYGKVESVEDFGVGTKKYNVLVTKDLKGNPESLYIDVYEFNNLIDVGKDYLLFLNFWESELYPKPVYSSIRDYAIEVVEGKIIEKGEEGIFKGLTLYELEEYILSSPNLQISDKPESNIIEKLNSVEELINASDHILHIIPKEIQIENKYVKGVTFELINEYKGKFDQELAVALPSFVNVGEEYIVFLKGELDYSLVTREGSVISKDDSAKWKEVLSYFFHEIY